MTPSFLQSVLDHDRYISSSGVGAERQRESKTPVWQPSCTLFHPLLVLASLFFWDTRLTFPLYQCFFFRYLPLVPSVCVSFCSCLLSSTLSSFSLSELRCRGERFICWDVLQLWSINHVHRERRAFSAADSCAVLSSTVNKASSAVKDHTWRQSISSWQTLAFSIQEHSSAD